MQSCNIGARACATILFSVAAFLAVKGTAEANPQIYRRVLHSTGWVVVPAKGDLAAGTCFVVDQKNRLAITCRHVVGQAQEALIYFPVDNKGELAVDSGYYLKRMPAIHARVVARDAPRDLALLQLDSIPAGIEALPLATHSPCPGDVVHSIGNSGLADSGTLWWYTQGYVRQVFDRRVDTPNGITRIRIVDTQAPVNRGDSGGPVVNDRGRLIGVAASYTSTERLVSQSISAHEVKLFLERAKKPQTAQAAFADATGRVRVASGSKPPVTKAPSPYSVVGRWRFVIQENDGQTIGGHGDFRKDETFTLSSTPSQGETHVRRGRFAVANGVMLLIGQHDTAIVPLTWTDANHFRFKSEHFAFSFERQAGS